MSRETYFVGPEPVLNELVKLNGIEIQEKILVIDETKKKSSTLSLTPSRQIPADISQKSQRQTAFSRTPVVPGHISFFEVTKSGSTNSYNTLIFSGSIPRVSECTNLLELLETIDPKCLIFQAHHSMKFYITSMFI